MGFNSGFKGLNDEQFSKSKNYTVMVRCGGRGWGDRLLKFIHSLISTKSMQGDMLCMNWFLSSCRGFCISAMCLTRFQSLSQWKFPRYGATNESLQDWRLELSIVDIVQGSRSVLQQPRWKVISLTGDDT